MSVGGNDEACRYSGINDKLVILKTFVLSGLSTAIGAILLCSRGASAQCTIGESYEFDVISGVILGGASLNGGSGSVYKTFVGVMILVFWIMVLSSLVFRTTCSGLHSVS